jgi:Flp pilus assembly protein TadD
MTKEEFFEQAVDAYGEDKLHESIALYRKALEIDPEYKDALHGLGMALFKHGNLEEAAETAKRLIQIDADDVLAHTSLSMIYHAQGRIEEAEKEGNVAKIMGWKEELQKGKNP